MKPDQKHLVLFDKRDFQSNLKRHLDEALSKFCAHCIVHVLGDDTDRCQPHSVTVK